MQFAQSLTSEQGIFLILAHDRSGQACYFFLRTREQDYDIVRRSFNKRSLDLTRYGTVIASGWGHEPSIEVKEKLKREFGFDADTLQ